MWYARYSSRTRVSIDAHRRLSQWFADHPRTPASCIKSSLCAVDVQHRLFLQAWLNAHGVVSWRRFDPRPALSWPSIAGALSGFSADFQPLSPVPPIAVEISLAGKHTLLCRGGQKFVRPSFRCGRDLPRRLLLQSPLLLS